MSVIAKSQTLLTEKEFAAYGRAGAIAEEVLSSIRTVVAFGGQKKEVERFEKKVKIQYYYIHSCLYFSILLELQLSNQFAIFYSSHMQEEPALCEAYSWRLEVPLCGLSSMPAMRLHFGTESSLSWMEEKRVYFP